jgi:fatty acid desaturase
LALTFNATTLGPVIWIPATALLVTLHWSLQHELVHGHPTRDRRINALLGFPALGVFVPYGRFLALHMAHHGTGALTDPTDDPESFYLSAEDWARTSRPWRHVLRFNNTLIGRCLIGPCITLGRFYRSELGRVWRREPGAASAWALHGLALSLPMSWLSLVCDIPPLTYLATAGYLGMSLLLVRSFAEHRWHPDPTERTVIIEDRSALALLFLNNNLHAVHHAYPWAPWYALPGLFEKHRGRFLRRPDFYHFPGYGALLARYAFRPKESVVHPGADR